jgi:hypothetical protein
MKNTLIPILIITIAFLLYIILFESDKSKDDTKTNSYKDTILNIGADYKTLDSLYEVNIKLSITIDSLKNVKISNTDEKYKDEKNDIIINSDSAEYQLNLLTTNIYNR